MSKTQLVLIFTLIFKFLYLILWTVQPKNVYYAQDLMGEAENLMEDKRF